MGMSIGFLVAGFFFVLTLALFARMEIRSIFGIVLITSLIVAFMTAAYSLGIVEARSTLPDEVFEDDLQVRKFLEVKFESEPYRKAWIRAYCERDICTEESLLKASRDQGYDVALLADYYLWMRDGDKASIGKGEI